MEGAVGPYLGEPCTEVPGKYFQFVDEDIWLNYYQHVYQHGCHKYFKELRGEQANKYRMDILLKNDVDGFDDNAPKCMLIRSKNPMHKLLYISYKTICEILPN